MFFSLSKILSFLIHPIWWVLILLALALLLLVLRRLRLAAASIAAALLIVVLGGFTNLGLLLLQPLEQRFPQPTAVPEQVDGIIVLGGGMDADVNEVRRGFELSRSGDRFVEALRLAQARPGAQLLIAGGSGALHPGEDSEAAAGARFFAALGIAPARLMLEQRSRNTDENARFARELAQPQPESVWLLVTSAFHMPRAVALFRKADFDVVPWPADYLSTGREGPRLSLDQPTENFAALTLALREWTGLAVYQLTGRIDSFFPAP